MKRKKNLVDPAAELRRVYSQRMQECERATRAGNLPAIVDAIRFCTEFGMPPPPWLACAVETIVVRLMLVPTGRGRFNSRMARWSANQKHFARWDVVNEILERGHELYARFEDKCGLKQDSAFAEAAKILKGNPAEARKRTIEDSYRLVKKRTSEGFGPEFYITRFQPNGK